MSDDKPKLLIVEDDVGLQRQLKWCFDDYEVLMAATRNEALAQLRRFEPPVVLQDLGLPPDAAGVSEGIATLKEIVSIAPQTKVIVVTGNNDRDNAVRAVSLGAYDFYQQARRDRRAEADRQPRVPHLRAGRTEPPADGGAAAVPVRGPDRYRRCDATRVSHARQRLRRPTLRC